MVRNAKFPDAHTDKFLIRQVPDLHEVLRTLHLPAISNSASVQSWYGLHFTLGGQACHLGNNNTQAPLPAADWKPESQIGMQ